MAERPIILSGPMVRAILAGRKSQTRRVVQWPRWADEELREILSKNPRALAELGDGRRMRIPYGVPGDRLWVRETWSASSDVPSSPPDGAPRATDVWYEADGMMLPRDSHWRPSTYMPRYRSRILLEVLDVRIERVQDISVQDVLSEGLEPVAGEGGITMVRNDWYRPNGWARPGFDLPRLVFADLWDSSNARRGHGWNMNPTVWAVTFRRIDDDAAPAAVARARASR